MIREIEQSDFQFKTKPYEHQGECFDQSRDAEVFAYLMEMGTGKTKVTIDVSAWLYSQGKINFLLVSAPNDVHADWARKEIPAHLPDWVERRVCIWSSTMKKADWENYWSLFDPEFTGLRILVVNHDAFSAEVQYWDTPRIIAKKVRKDRPRFGTAIKSIMNTFNVMFAVDESSKIKTPGATRSQRHVTIGKKAKFRRILTGTLGDPLETFMQFSFLDATILGGHPPMNFFAYKHRYATWQTERNHKTGRNYQVCTGYRRLEELNSKINAHSFRVLKKDCLDLPDKIYKRRPLQLEKEQRRIYEKVKQQSILELRQEDTSIANVLVKYLRLQQIIGGWVPNPDGPDLPAEPIFESPEQNPRIKALMDVIEENPNDRVIIWARFRAEIEAITDILNSVYPDSAVKFYGSTSKEEREDHIFRFQGQRAIIDPDTHQRTGWEDCPDDKRARFMVANQHSGGYGHTWTAATLVVYYSNDFSLEARLQSEDRCHRIGQTSKVLYVDLEAANTLDARILRALKEKKKLADTVVGDAPSDWF